MEVLPPLRPGTALSLPEGVLDDAEMIETSVCFSKIHTESEYVRHRAVLTPN